jgi:cytochrome bd-type quinol oxidase subunit 2
VIYWLGKFFSDPKAHWRAFCEVAVVTVFSLAAYVGTYLKHNSTTDIIAGNLMDRGQIFLLIYSLFGTLFYLAFIHVDKPSNGPKKFFGFWITLIILFVVFLGDFDASFSHVVNKDITRWGFIAYGFYLFSYYALLFYQELAPPDPTEVIDRDTKDMADRARELTNGQG